MPALRVQIHQVNDLETVIYLDDSGSMVGSGIDEGCAALDTVSCQCCPWLGDEGFRALCARCPLRHITLKHCAVTQEAIDQAEQAHPQLQIRCVQSGNRL